MNHIVIARNRFKDFNQMEKYLKISKQYFIPAFKNQTCKNFKIMLMINPDHLEYLTEFFKELNPIFITNIQEYNEYVFNNKINIQTRQDIDDYSIPTYIEEIQRIYTENIKQFPKFLVQSQPIKYMHHDKKEVHLGEYTDTRTSMFLSLCQQDNNIKHTIFDRTHGNMWEVANTVFTIPKGHTKWVIHGNNISCNRKTSDKYKSDRKF